MPLLDGTGASNQTHCSPPIPLKPSIHTVLLVENKKKSQFFIALSSPNSPLLKITYTHPFPDSLCYFFTVFFFNISSTLLPYSLRVSIILTLLYFLTKIKLSVTWDYRNSSGVKSEVHAVLAKDLGLVLGPHMVVHNHL